MSIILAIMIKIGHTQYSMTDLPWCFQKRIGPKKEYRRKGLEAHRLCIILQDDTKVTYTCRLELPPVREVCLGSRNKGLTSGGKSLMLIIDKAGTTEVALPPSPLVDAGVISS